MIPVMHFIWVGIGLFCLGLYAVLSQKNVIRMLIGVELMLNAGIINLVAFGQGPAIDGQMLALFAMILAAAAAAVALVLVLKMYHTYGSIHPDEPTELKQ